jgi:DNA-binding transcriptional LysR family regulator
VSQHLRRLESETGLVLIDRGRHGGGRSLQLTADGERIADQAEKVADALADAERAVEMLRGRKAGPVRIGGFASSLVTLVAPTVAALATVHPAIDPHVVEADDASGMEDLRAGRLDLLLSDRTDQTPAREANAINEYELLHDPFRIAVPAAWEPTISAAELLNGPWVTTPPDYTTDRILSMLAGGIGARPERRHRCTESTTVLSLVAAGLGAAIVPELSLAHLQHVRVRILSHPLNPGTRLITACCKPGSAEPGTTIATVLDQLRQVAQAHNPGPRQLPAS